MEGILHLVGICGDNQNHFDLLDLLYIFGGASGSGMIIKYYWGTFIFIFKDFFKNKNKL